MDYFVFNSWGHSVHVTVAGSDHELLTDHEQEIAHFVKLKICEMCSLD